MANLGGDSEARWDSHGLQTLWGRIDAADPDIPRRRDAKRRRKAVTACSVISLTDDDYVYKPQTEETRAAYEDLLRFIQQNLGAQPLDVLAGAAHEVLAILKDDTINSKKMEIEKLLHIISDDMFDHLVSIGNHITDFHDAAPADDSSFGVAVEFQDFDEHEEQHDAVGFQELGENEESDFDQAQHDDEATLNSNQASLTLNVQDIDAYWLRRKVTQAYGEFDGHHCKLVEEIIKIIAQGDDRDVENRLAMLLDYDKFDLIKFLIHNRLKIVWCTRLARAKDQEQRNKIEEEMASNPSLAPILEDIFESRASAKRKREQDRLF